MYDCGVLQPVDYQRMGLLLQYVREQIIRNDFHTICVRLFFSLLLHRILVTCLGCISCTINGFIYPFLVFRCNIPIPFISIGAGIFQSSLSYNSNWSVVVANFLMGGSTSLPLSIIGCVVNELGYDFSTPAPASIISVRIEWLKSIVVYLRFKYSRANFEL